MEENKERKTERAEENIEVDHCLLDRNITKLQVDDSVLVINVQSSIVQVGRGNSVIYRDGNGEVTRLSINNDKFQVQDDVLVDSHTKEVSDLGEDMRIFSEEIQSLCGDRNLNIVTAEPAIQSSIITSATGVSFKQGRVETDGEVINTSGSGWKQRRCPKRLGRLVASVADAPSIDIDSEKYFDVASDDLREHAKRSALSVPKIEAVYEDTRSEGKAEIQGGTGQETNIASLKGQTRSDLKEITVVDSRIEDVEYYMNNVVPHMSVEADVNFISDMARGSSDNSRTQARNEVPNDHERTAEHSLIKGMETSPSLSCPTLTYTKNNLKSTNVESISQNNESVEENSAIKDKDLISGNSRGHTESYRLASDVDEATTNLQSSSVKCYQSKIRDLELAEDEVQNFTKHNRKYRRSKMRRERFQSNIESCSNSSEEGSAAEQKTKCPLRQDSVQQVLKMLPPATPSQSCNELYKVTDVIAQKLQSVRDNGHWQQFRVFLDLAKQCSSAEANIVILLEHSMAARYQGHIEDSKTMVEEALEIAKKAPNTPILVGRVLLYLAGVYRREKKLGKANDCLLSAEQNFHNTILYWDKSFLSYTKACVLMDFISVAPYPSPRLVDEVERLFKKCIDECLAHQNRGFGGRHFKRINFAFIKIAALRLDCQSKAGRARTVSEEHIKTAKGCLDALEKRCLDGLSRGETIQLYLCRADQHYRQQTYEMAEVYSRKASAMAEHYGFKTEIQPAKDRLEDIRRCATFQHYPKPRLHGDLSLISRNSSDGQCGDVSSEIDSGCFSAEDCKTLLLS